MKIYIPFQGFICSMLQDEVLSQSPSLDSTHIPSCFKTQVSKRYGEEWLQYQCIEGIITAASPESIEAEVDEAQIREEISKVQKCYSAEEWKDWEKHLSEKEGQCEVQTWLDYDDAQNPHIAEIIVDLLGSNGELICEG